MAQSIASALAPRQLAEERAPRRALGRGVGVGGDVVPCGAAGALRLSERRRPRPLSTTAAAALPASLPLPQLLPASGPWGVWAGLIAAGFFGMWAEVRALCLPARSPCRAPESPLV